MKKKNTFKTPQQDLSKGLISCKQCAGFLAIAVFTLVVFALAIVLG